MSKANYQLTEKFSSQPEVDFRPAPSISLQAIELEKAVLGAILLDLNVIASVEGLAVKAFSIFAYQKIFALMLELHHCDLQPDLPTVAFRMAEEGSLKSIGGQAKLAQLLDRTIFRENLSKVGQPSGVQHS
jgi:replicative DNA helicase